MKSTTSNIQFMEGLGRTILDYFECETFPMKLLQDPVLNLLYTKVQLMKTVSDKSLTDEECYIRIHAILEESRKRPNY